MIARGATGTDGDRDRGRRLTLIKAPLWGRWSRESAFLGPTYRGAAVFTSAGLHVNLDQSAIRIVDRRPVHRGLDGQRLYTYYNPEECHQRGQNRVPFGDPYRHDHC